MLQKTTPTYWVKIHLAGDIVRARQICRDYCDAVGLCVTVTPTTYVYTSGEEEGVTVGLINYPRFPSTPTQIWVRAEALMRRLVEGLGQQSATIETPEQTYWHSWRVQEAVLEDAA